MNDLYTLLTVRDELEKAKKFAKSNARHQWTGLQAAMNIIQNAIQAEVDFRDAHAPQDAVLSPNQWVSMAEEYAGPDA